MRPGYIALNDCIKDMQNNVQQIIIILIYEKSQLNTLTPIIMVKLPIQPERSLPHDDTAILFRSMQQLYQWEEG